MDWIPLGNPEVFVTVTDMDGLSLAYIGTDSNTG
jgi:hypothetical protein